MTIFASDTERDLVTAASAFLKLADLSHDNLLRKEMAAYLARILRTYDPKPEKEYTMPEWEEFVKINGADADKPPKTGDVYVGPTTYNAIRESLSKPKDPSE